MSNLKLNQIRLYRMHKKSKSGVYNRLRITKNNYHKKY